MSMRTILMAGVAAVCLIYSGIEADAATYTLTVLNTLGGSSSYAADINDSGQVVGYSYTLGGVSHATLWDTFGTPTDLGTLGGDTSSANGINNSGQIVGQAQVVKGYTHATFWDSGGTPTDLGTLGGDALYNSAAYGINCRRLDLI